ncbi:hypothetical protein PVT71_14670 [Salipiger sp. H15]|uniref:Uncharacterized protein n=1 Tax=Alloyangia sp. H15 TaxID=3029062 RepID=A0AAU8AML8_9RHOB
MDHIQHHLRLLRRAIREGNRPASSALAGDLADIFAALSDDEGNSPSTAIPRFHANLLEEGRQ